MKFRHTNKLNQEKKKVSFVVLKLSQEKKSQCALGKDVSSETHFPKPKP